MAEDVTKKKVNIELEVDTSVVDSSQTKYKAVIDLARAIDSWRIFPRIFITTYIILLYKVVVWFMALETPNFEQSGLVSIVVGAGAAWFGLYVGSGGKKK
jgi:t-SNARE complex subunit (syntaxin)